MPIPDANLAYVPPGKVTNYLLNESHRLGGSKARWFRLQGYDPADPSTLTNGLLEQVSTLGVTKFSGGGLAVG